MGNTPNIRFKGFTDDWEQRKLGEVFQEYSEKNHPELPALTIIQGGGTVLREESERKLQYDKSSLAGYKMVREDDFIVHLRSFEGGLEKSNHNGLISPAYHTFHGDEVDSRFYYPYFRSYEFIKHKLVPHVYGIRDGRSIDIDSMKTIEIPWTSYEEQKKIGDYIESLDTLITLHQRKCDETKKLKKFMLQKMFPKKDAKKPEIRFAGFTDDWEQRKLVDVVDVRSGRDYKHLEEGDIPVYGTGGYMLSVNEALSDDEDAIGIGRKGTIDNPYILRAPFWTVDTLFYAVPRDKYDLNFVFDIFQNVNWKAKDESTGVPSLSKATINAVETLMPEYAEQKKIGEYFSYLDNFITLHQRKLFLNFAKRNDWEQRKLVDVVDVRSGRDYKHLEEGDIPVYGTGGYMLSVNEALSDDEDAIGIGRKGTIDNPYILRAPFWTVDTLFYAVPRDKYDLNFVFDIFQNVNWKAKDESTGVPSLSKATINAVETLMPEYAEQKKIGEYFSYLDNFITLHRRAYYNKKGGLTNVHNDNQQHYAIL